MTPPRSAPAPAGNPLAAQAFHEIRVLDFTQVMAGPIATQLLGDLGAQIIKIEAFGGGDQMRRLFKTPGQAAHESSASFKGANRGKRSVALDLKDPRAVAAVLRIASQCDVIVENFRAGVIGRLGLGYEVISQQRPDVIYCSISGFGQSGPLSGQSAYDGGIQAASGMMSTTGHAQTGPVRTGYLPVDTPTGLLAAFAISSALLRRERTGKGQFLDIAMMDAALLLQMPAIGKYLHDGTVSLLNGNASPAHSPLADTYATRDGFLAVSAVTPKHGKAALACLGLPEHLWDDYMVNAPDSAVVKAIQQQVQAAFLRNTAVHWEAQLRKLGLAVEPVNTIAQALAMAKRQGRPIIAAPDTNQTEPTFGAAFVANEDGPQRAGSAPEVGQHSREVLTEFGYSDAEIDALGVPPAKLGL